MEISVCILVFCLFAILFGVVLGIPFCDYETVNKISSLYERVSNHFSFAGQKNSRRILAATCIIIQVGLIVFIFFTVTITPCDKEARGVASTIAKNHSVIASLCGCGK